MKIKSSNILASFLIMPASMNLVMTLKNYISLLRNKTVVAAYQVKPFVQCISGSKKGGKSKQKHLKRCLLLTGGYAPSCFSNLREKQLG